MVRRLAWAMRAAFLCSLFGIALPKAGVPWFTAELFVVLFAGLMVLGTLRPLPSPAVEKLSRQSILLLGAFAAYAVIQIIPIGQSGWANAGWSITESALAIAVPHTISIAPDQSLWTLPRALLPFVVFLSTLALFRDDRERLLLWKATSLFGSAFAAYGMLQLFVFPEWLLFEQKVHYLTSLTSVFVNRNSAATFLGLSLLASAGLFVHALVEGRAEDQRGVADPNDTSARLPPAAILFLSLMAIQFVGLVLTTSRGGFLSTLAGSTVFLYLMRDRFSALRRLSPFFRFVVVAIGGLIVLDLFAGRVLYRIETSGVDEARLCTFQSTWTAALDNLPFGSGLGTFMDVFPMYRDPACGLSGIWDLAHNTYLEMLLELGIIYPVLLAIAAAIVVRTLRAGLSERRRYRPMVAAGLAMAVLVALHSLVDFSLQIPAVSALFAALLASSMAIAIGRR